MTDRSPRQETGLRPEPVHLLIKLSDSRMALGAVILLSLAVKIVLLQADKTINTDGILYITAAKYFDSGRYAEGMALFRMPAYPFLLHLMHTIIPDWITAARCLSILAYTATILPLYGLTRRLFDHQSAIWACVLFALSPMVNIKAMDVVRDPIFILLLASYLFCFLKGIGLRAYRYVFAAFICAAASFLFRIEALVLLTAPVLYLGLYRLMTRKEAARRWTRTSLMAWVAALLLLGLLAFLGLQYSTDGNVIRYEKIRSHLDALDALAVFDNYNAIYDHLKIAQQNPPFRDASSSIAALTRHWMPLIYLLGQVAILLKVLFPAYLIPLFIALKNLIDRKLWRDSALNFILVLFCVYFLFIYYAYLVKDFLPSRLLFPLAFMLFGLMGKGMREGLQSSLARTFPKTAMAVIVLLFLIAPVGRAADKTRRADTSVRSVGVWLKANQNLSNQTILSAEPKVLFYADKIDNYPQNRAAWKKMKKWQTNGDHQAIEDYARRRKAHVIVMLFENRPPPLETLFAAYRPAKAIPGRKGQYVVFTRVAP